MNASKWNAYNLAVLMSIEYLNGFSVEMLRAMIKEHLGVDKRTVQKYQSLMNANKYYVTNKNSNEYDKTLIINPNIQDMKPKSLKQLISEKQRVKN